MRRRSGLTKDILPPRMGEATEGRLTVQSRAE